MTVAIRELDLGELDIVSGGKTPGQVIVDKAITGVGAAAGAWAGARVGALIGIELGPWGAVGGGIIGGIAGALWGSFASGG
jgi:trimeric autotransporter adhesin